MRQQKECERERERKRGDKLRLIRRYSWSRDTTPRLQFKRPWRPTTHVQTCFGLQLLTASKWQDLWPTNRHGRQPINLAKGSNVKGQLGLPAPRAAAAPPCLSVCVPTPLSLFHSQCVRWKRKQKSTKAETKCKLKLSMRRMLNGNLGKHNTWIHTNIYRNILIEIEVGKG